MRYTYKPKQSNTYPMERHEGESCLVAFVAAALNVVAYCAGAAVIYFGYLYLVRPFIHQLVHIFP